jgi:hypothetical protein
MESLFRDQATFYELTLHLEKAIQQQLKQISPDLLKLPTDEAVQRLVEHYTLHVPTLDRDHITESEPEQIQMEVPADTQNRVFFGPGPHFVRATAITIRIPFTGDRNLFRYSANGFGGNYIDAQLGDDAIIMTHRSEHPDPAAIQRDFGARLNRIDTALQFVREQARQFNDKLPHLIRNEVMKQQAIQQRIPYSRSDTPKRPHQHL